MISIRKMTIEDTDEVLAMMRVFYDSPAVFYKASDEILMQDIKDSCDENMPLIDGYILEEDGQIAGYSMVAKCYATEFGGMCIWIEDLYLKPSYRNCGAGTAFFAFLEETYKNAVRFKLEVETENEVAVHTYKKCGYGISPYFVMTKEMD